MNPPSVNIFLTTPNVPYITIRTNSLSSLELALHFLSPPWKRLSSNLWILFSANKKNSFTPWRSPKPLKFSIGWLFQRFDEVQITCSTRQLAFSYLLNPFLLATALTNEISLLFCIWTNSVVSPHPSDDIPWRVSDEKLWDESLTSR